MDKRQAINIAKEYAETLREYMQPDEIFLYGSYAYGQPTESSDIDIAVIVGEYPQEYLKTCSFLWELASKINIDIEPVLLNKNNDPSGFVSDVRRKGIVL